MQVKTWDPDRKHYRYGEIDIIHDHSRNVKSLIPAQGHFIAFYDESEQDYLWKDPVIAWGIVETLEEEDYGHFSIVSEAIALGLYRDEGILDDPREMCNFLGAYPDTPDGHKEAVAAAHRRYEQEHKAEVKQ